MLILSAGMEACGEQSSVHIVKQVALAGKFSGPPDSPYSVFNGMMWRLYLEYCELGSIATLLDRRVSE